MKIISIAILTISLLLALLAAFLASRLIHITGKRKAWICISIAIVLMAVRRVIPLLHLTFGAAYYPDLLNELFGLVLSALMVAGAALIGPYFLSIKESEKQSRESREWLFTTLKSIGDAVIATDTSTRITFMNPVAQAITGYKLKEIVGKPLKEVFITLDTKTGHKKEDPASKVIKKKSAPGLNNHTLLITKNRLKISIDESASPIKDAQENIIGVVLVFRDITEKKQAEESVKLAHKELNQIFNTAADGMRVIDQNFNVVRINDRFSALLGLSKEAIVGKKCYEIFPGATCHTENCSMRKILSGETYLELDIKKKRVNDEITCIMTATPLRRSDGELIGIVEDFKDITQRKQTEEQLKRANKVIENSPTVLFRWKAEKGWPVEFVSENVTQFGYSPKELLSGALLNTSIIYPEDLERVIQEVQKHSVLEKKNFQQEYRIVSKNGMLHWVDARTVTEYDQTGKIIYYQGIILDITERKKAEEALRQGEILKADRQRLFSLLDVLPAIVYLQASNHTIPFANRTFRELFGNPEGRPCYEILYGFTGPCKECRISKVLAGKGMDIWKLSTSGRTYEMYDNLFTDIDNSLMLLEMGIDITEKIRMEKARKEVERLLEEQRARAILSDRLRSLGEMATGMAHELNQPLLGVRGLAEHILIGLKRGWQISEEKVQEKIRLIIDQTDRMTHVIEHARMYARGADNSEFQPVNINKVINSCMGLIGTQLRYRGLMLSCELAENLPEVLANPFSLEEVIFNLINNARDAVTEKMETQAMIESPQIIVQTFPKVQKKKKFIYIIITDRGVGIPKKILSRTFDPFFTTKSPDKGTGLGLAVSKSLIESFHGTIAIESTPGVITTVTITLPVIN